MSDDTRLSRHPQRPEVVLGSDGRVYREAHQTFTSDGYRIVGIRRGPGTERRSEVRVYSVHRLVLETFVGPCPEGMECRHLDGNPANNALDNLCWGTPAENAADKRRHGKISRRDPTGGHKLSGADIPTVRRLAAEGMSLTKIARRFGVCQRTIRRCVNRHTWKRVSLAHEGSDTTGCETEK